MRSKYLTIGMLTWVLGISLFAQETRLMQLSLVHPISTGGLHADNYSNIASLNILAGVNGGVEALEIGGLGNINRGNVKGAQVAGLLNYTTGNSNGVIISGLSNITQSNSSGVHISGLGNLTKNHSSGLLLGGAANISTGESKGVAIAGAFNYAATHKGLQLSTINVASEKMTGLQIGVVNVARKAKGVQLGVINICNSNDSILALGLVNIVQEGYYALEFSINELILKNLSFKMGTEQFYTIFRVGLGRYNKSPLLSTGIGFGTIVNIKQKHNINLEVITDQIMYDNKWEGLNTLNHLDLDYLYEINDFVALKAGPTINAYVTNQKVNNEFNTIHVPYTLLEYESSNIKTSLWIGFNVGIVIKL